MTPLSIGLIVALLFSLIAIIIMAVCYKWTLTMVEGMIELFGTMYEEMHDWFRETQEDILNQSSGQHRWKEDYSRSKYFYNHSASTTKEEDNE